MALQKSGPAILADSLALSLGFVSIAGSQVPANARLGCIVAAAMLVSAVVTLMGLPAHQGMDPGLTKARTIPDARRVTNGRR